MHSSAPQKTRKFPKRHLSLSARLSELLYLPHTRFHCTDTKRINFLKQAKFRVFACSVLSLYRCQVWGWSEILLPNSSLHLQWESFRFALSTANLWKPPAQSTSGPHKKVLSKADIPTSSLPSSLSKVHTSLRGTFTTLGCTWQNVGVTVQRLLEKWPERDLTCSFSTFSFNMFCMQHSLLSLACPRVPHSPQSHLFTCISLPVPDFSQTSGPSLAENKNKPHKVSPDQQVLVSGSKTYTV